MAFWKTKAARTATGARTTIRRKKRRFERGMNFLEPRIGKTKKEAVHTRGGGFKTKLLACDTVNVYDKASKKSQKARMETVSDNPANPHYTRRNILTKGAIVKTDLGLVRITSRPGQVGTLNGILIEKKK